MTEHFDAVFFDLGGTLFSYQPFRSGLSRVIEAAGRRLDSELERRELNRIYNRAAGHAAQSLVGRDYYLHRELFEETYRAFALELTGAPATPEFVRWFYAAQRQVMIEDMRLRDDCLDTLEKLRALGLALDIVSNIDDDFFEPMIDRSGLAAYVDRYTSSEAAQSCKPHAGFFEYCLERAGLRAERVLFVGDSPVHDVAGARALGMPTALIEEAGAPPPGQEGGLGAEPDYRISSLGELLLLVS